MNLLDYVKSRSQEIGDCWEWTGAMKHKNATPVMRYQQQTISVRRLLMLKQCLEHEGKLVTSACGNSLCVNPEHLELITRKRLSQRVALKFTKTFGLLRKLKISKLVRYRSKLTAEIADEIRMAEGIQREIAKRYGVSQSTVCAIKNGRTWRDYLNPFEQLGAKK